MKSILRLALAGTLTTTAAVLMPGAHAASVVGCVAVPDPRPATSPIAVAGSCDYEATTTSASFETTASHWQIRVNDHLAASGFGIQNGVIETLPGDIVTGVVFPDCDHGCLGLGTVTITEN